MNEILYDSKSELDKFPFGAAAAGVPLRFGLRVKSERELEGLSLILQNDEDGSKTELRLSPVWTEGGYTRYEGGLTSPPPGLYWYHFSALEDGEEKTIEKTANGAAFAKGKPRPWQLTVFSAHYTTPDWIKGGAFYHIFVDRFKSSGRRVEKEGAVLREDWGGLPVYLPDEKGEIKNNDFFGGDLPGIIEKLPYLHELGVSCIYLSPVFEAASNHKYDTGDYLKIDPAFGTEVDFIALCEQAAALGIKIILDGVFNHTGSDSIYFNREERYDSLGAYNSQASKYYKWYSFTDWPDKYEAWWGIYTLPGIKKTSLEYSFFINGEGGVLQKWQRLGVSGWRLDVADELSDSFLEALRQRVKAEDSEALIIGEVWEDASNKAAYGYRRHYFEGRQLDSVMNYPFKEAIIAYVHSGSAEMLRNTVEEICENYPKQALDCLMNILGTHDTPRILTALSGKGFATREERAHFSLSPQEREQAKSRLRLASLLQFTLPGVPCLYYGDEAGMEGFEDPFNRRCYPWGNEDEELRDWYKSLLAARNSIPAFAGGTYRSLKAEDGVFLFSRTGQGSKVLILTNLGGKDFVLPMDVGYRLCLSVNCEQNGNSLRVFHEGCAIIELGTEA